MGVILLFFSFLCLVQPPLPSILLLPFCLRCKPCGRQNSQRALLSCIARGPGLKITTAFDPARNGTAALARSVPARNFAAALAAPCAARKKAAVLACPCPERVDAEAFTATCPARIDAAAAVIFNYSSVMKLAALNAAPRTLKSRLLQGHAVHRTQGSAVPVLGKDAHSAH